MKIEEIENEIINEFEQFDEWLDKYNYLIELGKNLTLIDEQYKTDSYVISGCQSKVWLHATYTEGFIYFEADSDAIITKGIASLLIRVLSGKTPQEILDAESYFIEKTGLQQHLSPTRSNGLMSMVKQLKLYAMAYANINK